MWLLGEIVQISSMPFYSRRQVCAFGEPNNDIFNFENAYMVPLESTRDYHSGMRESAFSPLS